MGKVTDFLKSKILGKSVSAVTGPAPDSSVQVPNLDPMTGADVPVSDDEIIVSDTSASKILKRALISDVVKNAKVNVEPYNEQQTYFEGDIIRFFNAENFVCTEDTADPAGNFDPDKWMPENGRLDTGTLRTSFTPLTDNVSLSALNSVVTLTFPIAPNFETGENIAVYSASGNYDVDPWTSITKVDATTFTYSDVQAPDGTDTVTVQHATKVNTGLTQVFVVTNSRDGSDPIPTRALPIEIEPQIGYLLPLATDGVLELFVDKDLTPTPNFNTRFIADAVLKTSYNDAIIGAVATFGSEIYNYAIFPDVTYKRTLSQRLDTNLAGAKVFPGGVLSAGSSGLTLDISKGQMLFPGGNFEKDPAFPDSWAFDDISPYPANGTFLLAWYLSNDFSDTEIDGSSNVLDVNNYNSIVGGSGNVVPIPVTGPQYQIWRIYTNTNFLVAYYGQNLYSSVDEAQALIDNDSFEEGELSKIMAFRGYVITKNGITEWDENREGIDYRFIPKPQEYSIDRGNPQFKSGVTRESFQASIGNLSTGVIDNGLVTNVSIPIQTISGNGVTVTVNTLTPHNLIVGKATNIENAGGYSQKFVFVTGVDSATQFRYASTVNVGSVNTGTVQSLENIDIQEGTGQIANHSTADNFTNTIVDWPTESNIDLGAVADLSKSIIYIYKDIDGVTEYVSTDSAAVSASDIRDKILLAVVKTRQGLNSPNDQYIYSIQDQRISIVAPRLQIDDFTQNLFQVKVGAETTKGTPGFQMDRTSGQIVARGLNFFNDMNSPNVLNVGAKTNIEFTRIDRDGFIQTDQFSGVEPDNVNYDDGSGTLQSVGNPNYSAQRLWCEPETDQYLLQYGTVSYSASEIQARKYETEFPPNPPGLSNTAFVIATLVINGNPSSTWASNDDNQAIYFGDVTGGTESSSSGGGSASDTPWTVDHDAAGFSLYNLGDLRYTGSQSIKGTTVSNVNNIVHTVPASTDSHIFNVEDGVAGFQILTDRVIFGNDNNDNNPMSLRYDPPFVPPNEPFPGEWIFRVPSNNNFVFTTDTNSQVQITENGVELLFGLKWGENQEITGAQTGILDIDINYIVKSTTLPSTPAYHKFAVDDGQEDYNDQVKLTVRGSTTPGIFDGDGGIIVNDHVYFPANQSIHGDENENLTFTIADNTKAYFFNLAGSNNVVKIGNNLGSNYLDLRGNLVMTATDPDLVMDPTLMTCARIDGTPNLWKFNVPTSASFAYTHGDLDDFASVGDIRLGANRTITSRGLNTGTGDIGLRFASTGITFENYAATFPRSISHDLSTGNINYINFQPVFQQNGQDIFQFENPALLQIFCSVNMNQNTISDAGKVGFSAIHPTFIEPQESGESLRYKVNKTHEFVIDNAPNENAVAFQLLSANGVASARMGPGSGLYFSTSDLFSYIKLNNLNMAYACDIGEAHQFFVTNAGVLGTPKFQIEQNLITSNIPIYLPSTTFLTFDSATTRKIALNGLDMGYYSAFGTSHDFFVTNSSSPTTPAFSVFQDHLELYTHDIVNAGNMVYNSSTLIVGDSPSDIQVDMQNGHEIQTIDVTARANSNSAPLVITNQANPYHKKLRVVNYNSTTVSVTLGPSYKYPINKGAPTLNINNGNPLIFEIQCYGLSDSDTTVDWDYYV